jgi:gentisate 1,2-dioxygenase
LERLAAEGAAYPFDGVIMEYTNPVTGGPAMSTIRCYVQLLRSGEHTQAHRHTSSAAFHVVGGSGYSVVDGLRLACVMDLRWRVRDWGAGTPRLPQRSQG